MSSHTLTNLLSTANMTISGATLSEGVFTYPAGVFCMINQALPTPIVGHLYYGRVDQKVPANTSFGDGRFEYFGGDGTGKNIVFASFMTATMDNEWHTYSDIQSFPYISGENWTLRSFTVSGSNTVYRRKHMIIDLTEAFGAGNEPSKDWCDRCIPFFEGTKTIESKPLVGVNGIARRIVGGYVGVNGVARKIIKGYVSVNGVAKKIWGKQDPLAYFIEGNFTTYENELVTSIGDYAFSGCDALTSADFPNATSIGGDAFHNCTSLTSVSFPNATSIGNYAFSGCTALTDISFPNATSIGGDAFHNCTSLTSVSFPNATSIGANALDSCTALTYVTLLANQVCTIYPEGVYGKSFPSTVMEFRVPAALVDAYKADSNWKRYANKIVGV